MREFLRENSVPVVVSVLLHGLLLLAFFVVTYLSNHQRMPAVQPLPIDAVVVDSRALQAAQKALSDRAEEEIARARDAAAAKAAAEAQAREAAEADAANQAKEAAATEESAAAAKAATDAKVAADAKSAADAKAAAAKQAATAAAAAAAVEQQHKAQIQAQQRAAADAKAAQTERVLEEARRAAQARKALEAKQAEEQAKQEAAAKAAADAKAAQEAIAAKAAADAKRAADAKAKADREAELRRQLADEEHVSAVESGPLRDKYIAMLRNKIQNAWIKPPSATAGLSCMVEVTQVPGGEVTGARVTECNGDGGVRQSIENAVYRASPLPDPPDPALFERKITLRFVPNE
jgi:colicin import membrane protein